MDDKQKLIFFADEIERLIRHDQNTLAILNRRDDGSRTVSYSTQPVAMRELESICLQIIEPLRNLGAGIGTEGMASVNLIEWAFGRMRTKVDGGLAELPGILFGDLARVVREFVDAKNDRTETGQKPDTSEKSKIFSRVPEATRKFCRYLKAHVGKDGNLTDCVRKYCETKDPPATADRMEAKVAAKLKLANNHKEEWS